MSVHMHFATFLKFLTQSTGEKIRDLAKYEKGKGFDFYRTSRDGVASLCDNSKSLDEVLLTIESQAPSNGTERNREIAENTYQWLKRQSGVGATAPKGIWRSPNKVFSVQIEPEILLSNSGVDRVLAVYPRKEPRINRDQAGAGLLVLAAAYIGGGGEKFGILDAYAQKAFWSPTNASKAILDHDVAMIENELAKVVG
jgi:hypothetical protein